MDCITCKKPFKAARADARFCSGACRARYNRTDNEIKRTDKRTEAKRTDVNRTDNVRVSVTTVRDKVSVTTGQDKRIKYINKVMADKGLPLVKRASELRELEFISSGIKELDAVTGGLPKGRITEFYGLQGVGKSTLMLQILKSVDINVIYYDAESAVSAHYHGNSSNVDFVEEYILENVAEGVLAAIETNKYDLLVVDSVANLIPRAEVEGDTGDVHMGLKARLMGQWMRKMTPYLNKTSTAVVFINQVRDSMNPYGPRKFTPGGHALPFAASLRVEVKSNRADRKDWGHVVHFEVTKSKVCKPFQKGDFKLIYNTV